MSSLSQLGIWTFLIFVSSMLGCYLPLWIYMKQCDSRGSKYSATLVAVVPHGERNEVAMSYLMSFSAGVCLSVAFVFMISGISNLIVTQDDIKSGATSAGLIMGISFITFFSVEQIGSVLQDLHAKRCKGVSPCAVAVASEPLEAASVVRIIAEHKKLPRRDLQCILSSEKIGPIGTKPPMEAYSAPLLTDTANVACGFCQASIREETEQQQESNSSDRPSDRSPKTVIAYLLILFSIHSLVEGIGLGSTATSSKVGLHLTQSIALAILLHKGLGSFAVGASLLRVEMSWKAFGLTTLVFASMTPLGTLAGFVLTDGGKSLGLTGYFSLVAAGTFLFISVVELLPKSFDEGIKSVTSIQTRMMKICLFLVGSIAILTLTLLSGEY